MSVVDGESLCGSEKVAAFDAAFVCTVRAACEDDPSRRAAIDTTTVTTPVAKP
jgi:hypothetical protein